MTASSSDPSPAAAHSSEEALIATRRTKAEAARARGQNPFPNDVDASDRAWLGPLRQRFESALSPAYVDSTDEHGIPHGALEAITFALLGWCSFRGLPGNLPSATGAKRPVVLGSLTPPHVVRNG